MMTSHLTKGAHIILEAREGIKRAVAEVIVDETPTTVATNTKANTTRSSMEDMRVSLMVWVITEITSTSEAAMVMVAWLIHIVCNSRAAVIINLEVFILQAVFKMMTITKARRVEAIEIVVVPTTVCSNSSKVLHIS